MTGVHNDSLDRQVTEGVNISNFSGDESERRVGRSEDRETAIPEMGS